MEMRGRKNFSYIQNVQVFFLSDFKTLLLSYLYAEAIVCSDLKKYLGNVNVSLISSYVLNC